MLGWVNPAAKFNVVTEIKVDRHSSSDIFTSGERFQCIIQWKTDFLEPRARVEETANRRALFLLGIETGSSKLWPVTFMTVLLSLVFPQ
jgi:hypothetical protein